MKRKSGGDDATQGAAGYFNNQFLVAMPGLLDSNFNHTVTLLCEHNEQGALGLIINRPTDLKLADMLEHMKLGHKAIDDSSHIVYWGGPVQQERGFVVHPGPGAWESSLQVSEDLYITTSRDVLGAIGRGEGPQKFFVALGYAGWAAGQLEHEILENSWLNTPVDRPILFDTPAANRWQAATRLLGVDVTQLAGDAGHA
jgi:putative transcriptional regulator